MAVHQLAERAFATVADVCANQSLVGVVGHLKIIHRRSQNRTPLFLLREINSGKLIIFSTFASTGSSIVMSGGDREYRRPAGSGENESRNDQARACSRLAAEVNRRAPPAATAMHLARDGVISP